MPPKKVNSDPDWHYPFATRLEIENLRVYFSHFATAPRGWKEHKFTHALPRTNEPRERWASVPPHFRPQVEAWFQMMLKKTKRERGVVTPGKLRSLRMNAACFGRYVLTGKRRVNKSAYDRRKKAWLRYQEWATAEERKEMLARHPMPRKVLEIG